MTGLWTIAAACIGAAVLLTFTGPGAEVRAGGFAPVERYHMTGPAATITAGAIEATTTKIFLATTAAASTTITYPAENADQMDLTLRAVASSSLGTLRWTTYASDNYIPATGYGDWYPISVATTTGTRDALEVVPVSEPVVSWSLSTSTGPVCFTNEVCRHIVITNPGYAKYIRVNFGVTGSNASVWGYAVPRRAVPN